MKKLSLIITFLVFCAAANAQVKKDTVGLNIPVSNTQVIYTGVVDVPGKTKDELFRNAQQWFINAFPSQKDVIQDKDNENGIVYGRIVLYFSSGVGLGVKVNFADHLTVKIECKDGKYRYAFYNMAISNYDSGNSSFDIEQILGQVLGTQKWPWSKNAAKNTLKSNDSFIRSAVDHLKRGMAVTMPDF